MNTLENKDGALVQGKPYEYQVTLWSPDMRNEETYTVIAPKPEWAMLQAISIAFNGEAIDPKILDIENNEKFWQLDNIPQNLTIKVNGIDSPNYYNEISQMLNNDWGIVL